jgi:cytosine/adenosine deaminase-related metal-dependent hydrolase
MLISGGLVLATTGTAERLDIRVTDGLIADIGPDLARLPDDELLAAQDRLVVPGLVNAHIHSNEGFFKGRYDRLTLESWLTYSYPPSGFPETTPRDAYVRTLWGALEHLRRGTTTVVDFLYDLPRPTMATLDAACEAYRDAGIRAVLGVAVWDEPFFAAMGVRPEDLPGDPTAIDPRGPEVSEWRELLDAVVDRWHRPGSRSTVAVAPDQVQRCSDPLLETSSEIAERHGLALHVHALESRLCRAGGLRRYDVTQITHLARLGALTSRTSIVHGVWADRHDIDLLSEHGATLVHNPVSNLKLGSGVAPVPDYLASGVPVALGTDGDSTNDGRDLFEAVKMAALIHRVGRREWDAWIGAEEAWAMATESGARAAGLAGRIGRIERGMAADLVLLDLDDPVLVPLGRPAIHLVYGGASQAVREVIVDGRLVVRDGRSTVVEEADLAREVAERAERYTWALDAGQAMADALIPLVRRAHEEAWSLVAADERIPMRRRMDA